VLISNKSPSQPLRTRLQGCQKLAANQSFRWLPGALLRPLQVLNAMQQALQEVKLERDAARKQVRSPGLPGLLACSPLAAGSASRVPQPLGGMPRQRQAWPLSPCCCFFATGCALRLLAPLFTLPRRRLI
jgi:hypothetical protein